MIPSQLVPLANHLWQSTLFAAVVGLLTLLLRANRAQVRYWLWLSASAKMLIPFSILVAVGGLIGRHTAATPKPSAPVSAAEFSFVVEDVGAPFTIAGPPLTAPTIQHSYAKVIVPVFAFVWTIGFVGLLLRWILRWRRVDAAISTATPLDLPIGIRVKSSLAFGEPGVFGILKPVLVLPDGIMDRLTPQELEAILAHEICHVKRRDNLANAIHLAVEALLWFYPLVWWLGARLIEERERACDEEVLQGGAKPRIYAEGILKVCELYLASPLACVACVTGGKLKRRIEDIMGHRVGLRLNFAKRVVLTLAAATAVVVPVTFGVIHAPAMRAQSPQNDAPSATTASAKFTAISIKPFSTRPLDPFQQQFEMQLSRHTQTGRFDAEITPRQLIQLAYNLKDFQIVDGPSWANSDRYEIIAKADSKATFEQMQPMLRSLLADRFKLTFQREKKELPIYELGLAKSGFKIMPAKEFSCLTLNPNSPPPVDPTNASMMPCGEGFLRLARQGVSFLEASISMPRLIEIISDDVRRIVIDRTGFTGKFDLHLEFAPSNTIGGSQPSGPSISTALQEQLGLKLQPATGPVQMLLIDHLERPSEN